MKVAYLISAYADPDHLKRLVSALDDGGSYFFIHIDARINQALFFLQESQTAHGRVTFVSDRVAVRWGGFSQVEYQVRLLRAAIEHPIAFDRIFLLSGSDYPLVSNPGIRHILAQNPRKEWLTAFNLTRSDKKSVRSRVQRTHLLDIFVINHKISKILTAATRLVSALFPRRSRLKVGKQTWDVYVGSSYFCITDELASFIIHKLDCFPEILDYFRYTFVPEEMLIPTVVFNSAYYKYCEESKDAPGLNVLAAIHYFIYKGHVSILTEKDFSALIASGKMFGRKFSTGKSDQLVSMIDNHRMAD